MAKKKAEGKSESRFQSVITIDNYNHHNYKFEGNRVSSTRKLQFKRQNYYISFVANKDLIIAPVSVSRSIEDEDLEGALEDKAYDELGLDAATEYIINYRESFGAEGEGRTFQLFIMERERYHELFSDIRNSLKYVDLILPAPLLYQSLYDHNILENKKVHCFLYFADHDTTLTFYQNGEYLYSKSINYSLTQIYDRYCEIVGKSVDEKQFFRIFQKEGVKTTHLEFQQNLIKLFNEIFITINDIVIYTKRAYKVDVIDQMFIGSELGPISGADEYAQNYLGLYSIPMTFDFKIDSEEWYIDQTHYMMNLSAQTFWDSPEKFTNFSLYPRPPIFVKRASGQFIISLIFAVLAASAYPLFFLGSSYAIDLNNKQLRAEQQRVGAIATRYRRILAQKSKEIKRLREKKELLKTTYEGKEKTLVSVYNKKVNYNLKSNQLASFAANFKKFGVKSNRMMSVNDTYFLSIISNDDQSVTELIKDITNRYSKDIKMINIDEIREDQNNSLYQGVLKVELK
jgi:uncharacterized protein YktA (UPF0223 family)